MNARETALSVVRDVFSVQEQPHERSAQEALDYRFRRTDLSPRDRAFATALAYGAIKMRRTLDWYLRPYVGERAKPLPPAIGEILRVAVYELRFTGGQAHATVSEWVGLAKKYGHRGTAGLVNAVLRSFLRDNPSGPQPQAFADFDEYLGVAYSFPTWIVRQWRTLFGERAEQILAACNEPAQPAVVVNRVRTTRENVRTIFAQRDAEARFSAFAEDSVLISNGALAHAAQPGAAGAWWVQSESSAMVVDVLNPQPEETVADACSGRGSKALQSAARLYPGAPFCIERDSRKAVELERRAAEAGLPVATIVADATAPVLQQRFDRILIDAPCSGIGVVGRHPEARWRKRPQDGERLALTQLALLEALGAQLHEGGALVYAVCSTDPRETTDVIEAFLGAHNLARGLLPARFAEFETGAGDLLVPPGLQGRDGFYVTRLERRT